MANLEREITYCINRFFAHRLKQSKFNT